MLKYTARRVIGMVPTILILLFLVVLLVELVPGSVIDVILQEQVGDASAREQLEQELGLDRPLPVRYAEYVLNVARGDLGRSLWTDRSVSSMIAERAMVTMEIGAITVLLGSILGIALGAISAVKQDSWADYLLRSVAIAGISVPSFAIMTFVVVLPAIYWGISPNLRYVGPADAPWAHFKIIIVPSVILAVYLAAGLMRITRTTMLEVMRQDYIRTARAKGVANVRVIVRHALRNAILPVITVIGLQIAAVINGTVITESVFVIPGMGRLLLGSIDNRDYPVIQGVILMVGAFTLVVNLIVDLSYAWIDPRIRYG